MAETTTIYVTKGAETHGVRKVEATINHYGDAVYETKRSGFTPSRTYYTKAAFRLSLSEAIADAERRRAKKIASLERQIATMKALNLSPAVEG